MAELDIDGQISGWSDPVPSKAPLKEKVSPEIKMYDRMITVTVLAGVFSLVAVPLALDYYHKGKTYKAFSSEQALELKR